LAGWLIVVVVVVVVVFMICCVLDAAAAAAVAAVVWRGKGQAYTFLHADECMKIERSNERASK
jgi:hypothetical protein